MMPAQWTDQDIPFMARALALARKARHLCRPNPMVGAVLVRDGRVLGEGWHRRAGGPHAEIEALRACTEDPRGATLYVTLEPCCHLGKRTAPCVPAVIEAGIARLVAATQDPNPRVRGQGFAAIAAAGIPVEIGLLERPARELNQAFAWHVLTGRPFTTLKLAMTLDGRIADAAGRSRWITGDKARLAVQHLRSEMDAVLVGRNTAELDDPSLTVRLPRWPGPQPLRVVLDRGAALSADRKLLQHSPERTHVFAEPTAPEANVQRLRALGATVHRTGTQPQAVVEALAALGVQRLLIEGGGRVAGSFLDAALVQRAWFFYAPLILGAERARPGVAGADRTLDAALRLGRVKTRRLGPDLLVEGFVADPLDLWASS